MPFICVKCGQDVEDKYEFEIHRCMCEDCYRFYLENNPDTEEEQY